MPAASRRHWSIGEPPPGALGRFDLHRGRHLLAAFRGVREAEQPVGGDAAGLGDPPQRLGARHAVDGRVEELAQRRAVDAGVAQEGGDAAALLAEQRLQALAEGGGEDALVHGLLHPDVLCM